MLFDSFKYKIILKASFPETKVPFAKSGLHLEFEIEYKIEQCSMSVVTGNFFQDSMTL